MAQHPEAQVVSEIHVDFLGYFSSNEELDRFLESVPPPGLFDWIAWLTVPSERQAVLFTVASLRRERGLRSRRNAP